MYKNFMIIDSFIFSNELLMLDLRLNYLNDVVDKFILVESSVTHSGDPKELYFEKNKHRYEKYLHKIEHIVLENLDGPEHDWGKSWSRENVHRLGILKGLTNVPDDALVMVSDVDEIPRKEKVGQIGGYIQAFLYYYLDVYTGQPWVGTVCDTAKNMKQNGPQVYRDQRFSNGNVLNAGWHISFFMTPEEIQTKIKTFAHQEYNTPEFTNIDNIERRLHNLRDPFERHDLVPGGVDLTMPDFIFKNEHLFKDKFRFVSPWN